METSSPSEEALAVIARLQGQRANSTPRRDQFAITRRELEALVAVIPLIKTDLDESR
jgi:hypothetical protein